PLAPARSRPMAVLTDPFETPFKWTDDPISGDRRELALPGVKELFEHLLLCAGAPSPPPVPSRLTPLGLASVDCPLSQRLRARRFGRLCFRGLTLHHAILTTCIGFKPDAIRKSMRFLTDVRKWSWPKRAGRVG